MNQKQDFFAIELMDGANTVQNENRISSTLTDTQELWRWENLKEKEHRCIFYKEKS